MKFIAAVVSISSLMGIALAEPIRQRRANTTPLGQIYAYGNNISGFPVFVASGVAYIGNVSISTISGASNVTCKLFEFSRNLIYLGFVASIANQVLLRLYSRRDQHLNLSPPHGQQRNDLQQQ